MFAKTEITSTVSYRRTLRIGTCFVVAMLWLNMLFAHGYWEGTRRGLTDFSVLYTAGTILREGYGHQLYDRGLQYRVQEAFTGHVGFRRGPLPFIHPPFEGLIFWPLSLFKYNTAFLVWDAISVLALLGAGIILRSCIDWFHQVKLWKFLLCALAFFPVVMCLLQGQDSILLLLFCALALRAMRRDSDVAAGCWLALGSFKFQFTLPIVALFFLWKRRRVALGFFPMVAILVLASVGISGLRSLIDYPQFALRVVETQKLGGVPLALLPNLHGLIVGWNGMTPTWPTIAAAVAASILLLGFAFVRGRKVGSASLQNDFDLQFSLASVIAVLVAWQTNIHDLSLLILPLILVIGCGLRSRNSGQKQLRLLYPALLLLISPLWMILWLKIGHVNLMAIPLIWWAWVLADELSDRKCQNLGVTTSGKAIP